MFIFTQFLNTSDDLPLNDFPKENDLFSVLCANLDLLPTTDINSFPQNISLKANVKKIHLGS